MASSNGTLIVRPNVNLTDAAGNTWCFQAGQVYQNGVLDALTNRVIAIGFINGKVVQENINNCGLPRPVRAMTAAVHRTRDGHIGIRFLRLRAGRPLYRTGHRPIVDGVGNLWWI